MNLEPVIGLEIHVQLKTTSKMFCSCSNIFGDVEPNTAVCPICLGYPGTLPVPNKTAIAWTQATGVALNCELAAQSKFDRKSYFYPDLPKGYQISQYDEPLCGEGYLDIIVDGQSRRIGIERIHLEEDAAKNTHPKEAAHSLIDFNRAGTPLMEIVTKPEIRSAQEAKIFLQELQRIMRALGVSDADLEKGHMRCDANISLRERGSATLHPKTEIKNVNSFRFVERALAYEIDRQSKAWLEGKPPTSQATRGFNADEGVTYEQRDKEAAADYRYFPEPDIPPFIFSEADLEQARAGLRELPHLRRTRFMRQYALTEPQARLLVDSPLLAVFFENLVSELQQLDKEQTSVSPKEVKKLVQLGVTIIMRQLRDIINAQGLTDETLNITPENMAEVIVMVDRGRINKGAIGKVLMEMQRTGGDPDPIIATLGLEQVQDAGQLEEFVEVAIKENPEVVESIKAGKAAALQYLVGQVMAKSRGTADARIVTELLKSKLGL